jgi:hypothetical protein
MLPFLVHITVLCVPLEPSMKILSGMWGPNYACNMTGIQLVLCELAAYHMEFPSNET